LSVCEITYTYTGVSSSSVLPGCLSCDVSATLNWVSTGYCAESGESGSETWGIDTEAGQIYSLNDDDAWAERFSDAYCDGLREVTVEEGLFTLSCEAEGTSISSDNELEFEWSRGPCVAPEADTDTDTDTEPVTP
jgi:hypothetical protein